MMLPSKSLQSKNHITRLRVIGNVLWKFQGEKNDFRLEKHDQASLHGWDGILSGLWKMVEWGYNQRRKITNQEAGRTIRDINFVCSLRVCEDRANYGIKEGVRSLDSHGWVKGVGQRKG